MKKVMKRIAFFSGLLILILVIGLGIILASWYFSTNTSKINPDLQIELWNAVTAEGHNFNTDLLLWNDHFYLIYQHSNTHFFDGDSKLVLLRSNDCKIWEKISEIKYEGLEFRDPKLAVIGNTLFLYALKNFTYDPEPSQTFYATSKEGYEWSDFKEVEPKGYLFWKPKTLDSLTWYNTAYWHEHGKSILIKSDDGVNWEIVSTIYEGETNDETALEILSDGKIIVTARLEADPAWHSGSKNASTLIAYSYPPYTDWIKTKSYLTRLDGPALINVDNKLYAAARFDPEGRDNWFGMSSVFGIKRTAIYLVTDTSLTLLTELPSCGDTSYPGIVEKNGFLYIAYYTNDESKDYPWLLGMYSDTYIKIAKVKIQD
jgi:hypothetical protein